MKAVVSVDNRLICCEGLGAFRPGELFLPPSTEWEVWESCHYMTHCVDQEVDAP